MPQYVSLAQQGFFEPFHALGQGVATALGLVQNQQQMKQQRDLAAQNLEFEKSKVAAQKPLLQANIDEAQLKTQQNKAADILKRHNFTEALRPVLQPTEEDRKAFPDQDLGTGMGDYAPKDLSGISPEIQDRLPPTAKFKRIWKPINLDTTPFNELSPDLQRFATSQVQAKADKVGAGEIAPEDIAAAY